MADFLCPKNEETFSFSNSILKSGVYASVDEPPTGVTTGIYIYLRASVSSRYLDRKSVV